MALDRYHATALSNFIRGYDKYGRRYSKANIPESTYRYRFFVLRREELEVGIDKASRLLARTSLKGDRVLVLHTRVPAEELQPHPVGELLQRNFIDVESLFLVDGAELRAVSVEDAAADSLACHQAAAPRRWHELTPRTVSILPVARGCQAECDFCFSKASVSREVGMTNLEWPRIEAVLRAARTSGAERAVITGGGEPGLLPDAQLTRLIRACAGEFSKTVLITNGHHLAPPQDLASAGLTVLAVSCHHHQRALNARIMHLDTDIAELARSARRFLTLRLICVLQRGGIEDGPGIDAYLAWAASLGVGQVCFKELYVSTSRESVYHSARANAWSREHQVPLRIVLDRAAEKGWKQIAELPWGAPIFAAEIGGEPMQIAAYTEPSVSWELGHGICRSWNLMADGRCLASLEDCGSAVA